MYRKCEIRMWINHKFQNTIFKQLPFLIFIYIKDHPEELNKYLSNRLDVNELLAYIYEKTKETIHKPIIEIVNEYVDNYV